MDGKGDKAGRSDLQEEYEILEIQVRPDLYRAFRRYVWMRILHG